MPLPGAWESIGTYVFCLIVVSLICFASISSLAKRISIYRRKLDFIPYIDLSIIPSYTNTFTRCIIVSIIIFRRKPKSTLTNKISTFFLHIEFTAPVALSSTYCTLIEHCLSNILPIIFGKLQSKPLRIYRSNLLYSQVASTFFYFFLRGFKQVFGFLEVIGL